MDHSLWVGEQPQPNLRPKEQVPALIPWCVLQRQMVAVLLLGTPL